MPELWQSTASDESLWVEWSGDHVVYHRPSGKTHVLNAATAALLTRVLVEPKTVEAAARELAAITGVTAPEDFTRHITDTLLRLEQLGLVERK